MEEQAETGKLIQEGKEKLQLLIGATIVVSLLLNWSISSISGEVSTTQIGRNLILFLLMWYLYRGKKWARIAWITVAILGILTMIAAAGSLSFSGPPQLTLLSAFVWCYIVICAIWLFALFSSPAITQSLTYRADSDPEKQPPSDDMK